MHRPLKTQKLYRKQPLNETITHHPLLETPIRQEVLIQSFYLKCASWHQAPAFEAVVPNRFKVCTSAPTPLFQNSRT